MHRHVDMHCCPYLFPYRTLINKPRQMRDYVMCCISQIARKTPTRTSSRKARASTARLAGGQAA